MSIFGVIRQLIPGTGATDMGKAVDAAAGATDTGVAVLAKRVDYASVAAITPAAGDYSRLQVDELGRLHVAIGPYDPISRIPVVMDFDHHQLHEGEAHQWNWYGAVNSTSKDVRLSVPELTATTRTPHLVMECIADGTALVYLYEGTTWTSGGSKSTSYNRNRNSSTTPGMAVYVAGGTALTVNVLGTLLWQGWIISSAKSSLSSDRNLAEWDLKTTTEYHFRVTTTGNANVLIRLNWYEDLGV